MTPSEKHPIVGSAEPLSAEAARKRLRELEAWGVDLSLVDASLSRTLTERVERMVGLRRLIEELHRGYQRAPAQQASGERNPEQGS